MKYINVHMSLDKVIPIDEIDINKAIDKAKEIFYDKELTAEYLDCRYINFFENTMIEKTAENIAKSLYLKYGDDLNFNYVDERIEKIFRGNDLKDYIKDEVIKTLEKKYNIYFKNINI